MKSRTIFTVVLLVFSCFIISGCNTSTKHNPLSALSFPTPTPTCAPGTVTVTGGENMVCFSTSAIINTQAEFDAAYCGWAAGGAATPTPVPVDFTTKTLVGIRLSYNCGTSASVTGITTDCSAIYINVHRTTNCSMYTCHSVVSFMYSFLIDKTNLPIKVKTDTLQCDGSTVTDISPLQ